MTGIDIGGALSALYGAVNLPLLTILTAGAFILHRVKILSANAAILIPVGLGSLLGSLLAISKVTGYQGGYIQLAQLIEAVLEAVIWYGAGSVVIGRGVSMALDKLGWFPADLPPAPPANTP